MLVYLKQCSRLGNGTELVAVAADLKNDPQKCSNITRSDVCCLPFFAAVS